MIVKNKDENRNFEVDVLLPFFGLKMELGPIANWGLNLYENLIKLIQKNLRHLCHQYLQLEISIPIQEN